MATGEYQSFVGAGSHPSAVVVDLFKTDLGSLEEVVNYVVAIVGLNLTA